VNVVNAGQGSDEYKKLQTALKGGKGAPDVAQIEYQYVPTFTITNSLLDLAPYGANALQAKFRRLGLGPGGQRRQGIRDPAGHRPMGMLYRQDLFDKYGIAVPQTGTSSPRRRRSCTTRIRRSTSPTCPNEPGAYVGPGMAAGARSVRRAEDRHRRRLVNDTAAKKSRPTGAAWSRMARWPPIPTSPMPVPGARVGQVCDLADRRLGPLFLQGTAKATRGSGGSRRCTVVRGRAGGRQLGRFDDCGHQADQAACGRRRIRDVPEQ